MSGQGAPREPGLILSLVIPAFNEAQRLSAGVARLTESVEAGAIDAKRTEFIVVDDGSTDDTSARAHAAFSKFPHVRIIRSDHNQGKGAAVRAGIRAAIAPFVAFADADMAIDPAQTPQFLRALESADLAIGSRAASGAAVDRPSISRSVMNRLFNRLVNVVTKVDLDDTQCGFKAFRTPVAKLLFHCTTADRMAFDVEVLALARVLGFSIEQVPVNWLRVRGSRVRWWSDARSMVRDVLRARRTGESSPAVPGLRIGATPSGVVAAGTSAELLLQRLSRTHPVIGLEGGGWLVLFPLDDASNVTSETLVATSAFPDASVEAVTVTVGELRRLPPLALSREDASSATPGAVNLPDG